jgi:hypothetical protein
MSIRSRRERLERLRAIPLGVVLRAAGAKPDPHDPAKWHTISGTLSVTGSKFFDWNHASGGGGAIDLAMHLNRMRFAEAADWLACLFAPPEIEPPVAAPISRPLTLPTPVAAALSAVRRYLQRQRRLPLDLLEALVASDDLYSDANANAVFLLRNQRRVIVGAELRGTGPRHWRGMAPGSRKDGGYFAVGPDSAQALVLCESAIDAISCLALHPGLRCLSTSGARANPGWLPALLASNRPVYCGFDADSTGEHFAQRMIAHHPNVQRLRPPLHDWNDTLRASA